MTWRTDNPRSDHVVPEDDPPATDTDRTMRDREHSELQREGEPLGAERDRDPLGPEREGDQPAAERDRDPLAAENDQIVRQDAQLLPPDDDHGMKPGTDPVNAAHDELAPDDDLVIIMDDPELARDDDQVITTDDHVVQDDHAMHGGQLAPSEETARNDQPASGGTPDADSPARVFVVPPPAAEPAPVVVNDAGPAVAADTRRTSLGVRWHEVLAMFVDDPRTSVELASGLVDDSAEALVVRLRERQQELLSAWQGYDADTEELRNVLQRYRALWNRLEDFAQ